MSSTAEQAPGDTAGPAEAGPEPMVLDGTVRHLDPRYRIDLVADRLIVVGVVLVGFVILAVVVRSAVAAVVGVVLSGVGALLSWLVARWQWQRFTWRAEPEALTLARGIVWRSSSTVPYHRIQQIDVRQRPVQRMLGLATLVLRTAAATTDAELPGIPAASTDALRQELLHRAGLDDAV